MNEAGTSWLQAMEEARAHPALDLYGDPLIGVTDGQAEVFAWGNGTFNVETPKTWNMYCEANDVVAILLYAGLDPERGWMPYQL